ncbi:hypothetical protein NQ318_008206 [Aromia moschata]|uniref:Uncharacterized protein n=1 Tax=Aromia moschata TaxID=1265417 RepID=A0AAV8YIP9_9CUCU|nr:hypothetical protein NQ318_008206 [Aromia moschata]
MGLIETTNSESPVIFINGTAHCANMYNISDDDLPELTAARAEINRLVGVWLGESSTSTDGAHIQMPRPLICLATEHVLFVKQLMSLIDDIQNAILTM